MGLDKKEFDDFIKELVTMYSPVSKEKAKLYYDIFLKDKISIRQLQRAKIKLYKNKETSYFPTIGEIYKHIEKDYLTRVDIDRMYGIKDE